MQYAIKQRVWIINVKMIVTDISNSKTIKDYEN